MTKYVAIYCRLSPRPDGSYETVEYQERWGREYAAKTWPGVPVEAFVDPGVSAARDDVIRPEYERLREWIATGRVQHLWAVEQYRVQRHEIGWFQLAAELDAAGITELHTNRDGIVRVLDTVAGIKAVLGAGEVRRLRERINDILAEKAALGLPGGGGHFCYRRSTEAETAELGHKTLVVIEDRADAAREAADKILSGWSLANVTQHLDENGFRGAHGGKLTPNAVRRILVAPVIAGFRVHRRRIVGRGNWEPVLTEDTWQALRSRFAEARTVQRADGGTYDVPARIGTRTARRYLLSGGRVVAGPCGTPLVGAMKQLRKKRTEPYYICHPHKGGDGCVGIMAVPLEEYVVDRLFAELDKPGFLEPFAADDYAERREEILAKLAAVDRKRSELAALWGANELTDTEWRAARQAATENEQRLRTELSELPSPVHAVDIVEIRGAWPALTLGEQREILGLFVERVIVNRARPGAQRPTPEERVEIVWRHRALVSTPA